MKLKYFVSGLIVLALIITIYEMLTDPLFWPGQLTPYKVGWLIGAAFRNIGGGVLGGLVVWLPFRVIRGATNAPSPLKYSLFGAVITVPIIIFYGLFLPSIPLTKRSMTSLFPV